jgi:hypothetical protein
MVITVAVLMVGSVSCQLSGCTETAISSRSVILSSPEPLPSGPFWYWRCCPYYLCFQLKPVHSGTELGQTSSGQDCRTHSLDIGNPVITVG